MHCIGVYSDCICKILMVSSRTECGRFVVAQPGHQRLAVSGQDRAVFFGAITTYAQLLEKAGRLAGCLQALGVRKGDRVVLDMQNCPQIVFAHWAILRADAVVCRSTR